MYFLLHFIILAIYVYVVLLMNFPNIRYDNFIMAKLYVFGSIFLFELIIGIIRKIYNRCTVDLGQICKESLQTALFAAIAYSIYTDLVLMSNSYVSKYNTETSERLARTVLIVIFVMLSYLLDNLFTSRMAKANDCLNLLYNKK